MNGRWKVMCGVVAVAFLVGVAATAHAGLLREATYNGQVYQLLDSGLGGARTQQAYEDYAQSIHPSVHLVTIEDAAKSVWLNTTFTANGTGFNASAWTGFHQPNPGTNEPGTPGTGGDPLGFWRWYSDPLNSAGNTYTYWGGGEPNNSGSVEHSAELYTTGVWNDNNGTVARNGIIEYPLGFQFPYQVAQLNPYGTSVKGKACVYDPNTGTSSAPDRYTIEVHEPSIVPGVKVEWWLNQSGWTGTPTYSYISTDAYASMAGDVPISNKGNRPGSAPGGAAYPDEFVALHGDPLVADPTNGLNTYGVRWSGSIYIPNSDVSFATGSDDPSWLYLDGNPTPVLAYAAACDWSAVGASVNLSGLTPGWHDFIYQFYEGGGGDDAHLTWDPDGTVGGVSWQEIDAAVLAQYSEWTVLADVAGTQVGDLLNLGDFGTLGLPINLYEPYELRLSVYCSQGVERVIADVLIVPEPATLTLLGLGLLAVARRRRKETTRQG